jgi:hypothetical protein
MLGLQLYSRRTSLDNHKIYIQIIVNSFCFGINSGISNNKKERKLHGEPPLTLSHVSKISKKIGSKNPEQAQARCPLRGSNTIPPDLMTEDFSLALSQLS